jgi:tRNA G10  N-methylase Trm11
MNSKNYLFLLGNHPTLSRAELAPQCDEVFYDHSNHLLLAENINFTNPRDLPKAPEQIFLDRLGGTIWMAEVLGEFRSREDMLDQIVGIYEQDNKSGVQYLAMNYYGKSKQFWPDFLYQVRRTLEQKFDKKVRLENPNGKNLDSGRIFSSKLLRKGHCFVVWQQGDSFLLGKISALQNLRNYGLRDYGKTFRNAHMGMLPPKLAQMLINVAAPADPSTETVVLDPFCGSGTINSEAAIMGFKTIGSDLRSEHVEGAQKNYEFLSEKFRFPVETGEFFTADAIKFPWKNYSGVIATEGWLGKNFTERATSDEIYENSHTIMTMWEKFFRNLNRSDADVQRISFCLPAWLQRVRGGFDYVSIAQKLFAKIEPLGYIPAALNREQETYLYYRPAAFVAREICVVERMNNPR